MRKSMTKEEWIREYSYLPFKFKSLTEQKWPQIKANVIAILRKNFPNAKFRVYKYADTSMEIMFDGPQSKEEVYAEVGIFATMIHCSAGYCHEFWHDWNFMFGGVKYVFIKKKGEDLTYYVLKRKTKKSKKRR
jgi:hypothetical protein